MALHMLRGSIHSPIVQFFKHTRFVSSLLLRKSRPIQCGHPDEARPTRVESLPIELILLIQADPPSAVQRANWLIA